MDKELNVNDIKANAEMDANSYMTKDEFISMLQTMEFTNIKIAKVFLITGFKHDVKENETIPIGFSIDISKSSYGY